ncbi:MAG: hypothetical protein ACRDD7_04720 [Peptostreptococcaceae bacterium]
MTEQLTQEYFNLFEEGNESDLDFIQEYETEDTRFEVYYWNNKNKFVLTYGSYGNGFTDLCNIEFYDRKKESIERIKQLRGW